VTTSVDDLRKIPLFSRLSDADLKFLAAKVDELIVPAGTALITEGMGNHAFFLLVDGEVDVSWVAPTDAPWGQTTSLVRSA
jgi:CRP-like cAMP-binding protein